MTTLQNASSILPPERFTAAVRKAARAAVAAAPAPQRNLRRPILLIALVIFCLLFVAALGSLFAGDLFTQEQGFMLPDLAWGSQKSAAFPASVSFYGYTGTMQYQYDTKGQLISADITFTPQNQAGQSLPLSFLQQLSAELTVLYGQADRKTPIDGPALQQALREYLGDTNQKSEQERMADALAHAGADEELIARVQNSPNASQEYLFDSWIDESTHTALSLFASYQEDESSLRKIRLSLACLPEK